MAPSFTVKADYIKYRLNFKFDAGTSRGVLKTKDIFFLKVASDSFPGLAGFGEAGPLPKLSVDDVPDFETVLRNICSKISKWTFPGDEEGILNAVGQLVPENYPSIRFALEVALLDLIHGGKKKLFSNSFYDVQTEIPINGLIWMGDRDFMFDQIQQKLEQGYDCIKIKIGSIDFEQECALLAFIRERFSTKEVILRVDANGAFSKEEVMEKLQRLSVYDLHSIEQPIRQGQKEAMRELCRTSPVAIALDEELIGVFDKEEKERLLDEINPPYIILKPSLIGGIKATKEWISLANEMHIGWWMTSALESNIGLNAIAQLTSTYDPSIPQGLGTGQLYTNNIASPLTIHRGKISYDCDGAWGDVEGLFRQ